MKQGVFQTILVTDSSSWHNPLLNSLEHTLVLHGAMRISREIKKTKQNMISKNLSSF